MSDTQVALSDSANRQVESESTEETTLSEVTKDSGDSKTHEKTAKFEGSSNISVVEDNASKNVQSSCTAVESQSVTVSKNRQEDEENVTNPVEDVAPKPEAKAVFEEPAKPPQPSTSTDHYKPLEPIKPFEPLKPFDPIKPFEPVKPIEPPKSSESTQQIESASTENKNALPTDYLPVEALEPLKPFENFAPQINGKKESSPKAEIKEENIKNSLKEIISDLDKYAEKDKELKESIKEQTKVDGNSTTYSYERNSESRMSQDLRSNNDNWIAHLPSVLPKQRPVSLPSEHTYSHIDFSQLTQEINQAYGEDYQDENAPPTKPINLEKIFTPADGEQIQPKPNRKMFASSAFYSKGFHPTVEEQVELAKRISSSLSDISNQTSKGQSMFVNRKKRSVKWVHEGDGLRLVEDTSENSSERTESKDPLKLVMNPHGHIQDLNSLRKQGYNIEPVLSPDLCLEIVKDLNSPKGKGAELFAKRRKRSEKWVVAETNGTRPDPIPDIASSPAPLLSPLPPISSFPPPSYHPDTVRRMQHKEKLDGIQEKFSRPRVKLIKSPWDAALETGSVDGAFLEEPIWPTKGNYVTPAVSSYESALRNDQLASWSVPKTNGYNDQKVFTHNPAYNSKSINKTIDNLQRGVDVYKPTLPQAWNTNSTPKQQQYSSNSLPRPKAKAPLSPMSYKPNVIPQVFIPKESNSPLSNLYSPAYDAHDLYNTTPNYYDTPTNQPSHAAPLPPPRVNFNALQNYNTAPRGWDQRKNYYKPITFSKPPLSPSYSDF